MSAPPLDLVQPIQADTLPALRLRRQWCLARAPEPRVGWIERALPAGWTLLHHPDLSVLEASPGVLLLGRATLPGGCTDAELAHHLAGDIETALDELAGVYVVVCGTHSGPQVYTDPGAMLAVYHKDGVAASSPALLGELRRDTELDSAYPFGGTDDWYPGTLMPYHGVRALLANHVLDVASGSTHRFWPRGGPERRIEDEALERAAALLREHMTGLVQVRPCLVSLTGGRDSRISLAALREYADRVAFFTIRSPKIKACDLEIPSELAAQFGLQHTFIDDAPPCTGLLGAYDEMTLGLALGARRDIVGACAQLAGPDLVHVSGNLGAIFKSFFWHAKDPKEVRLDSLLKEFTKKPPLLRDAVSEWLASVPEDLPATMVYDLMYLEQRGGRWMGPGEAAANLFYEPYTPFSSRELFLVLAGMPPAALFGGQALERLSERLWPEAGAHRYCALTRNWGRFLPRKLKNAIRGRLKP